MEVAATTQQPASPPPAAPVVQSVEPSAQPEQKNSQTEPRAPSPEGEQETPQKRESRRQRQLNRERTARIQAETELRLYKEQQARQQPAQPARSDEPTRDQFGTYEEFIEARATFKAEKAAEERTRKVLEDSKKADREDRTKADTDAKLKVWNEKIEKARDEIDDFDEVCADSEAVVTGHMAEAIADSDRPGHIAYYLAQNPQEAERISKLSPSKQAAAIVALEDKVAKPVKQPSSAPEPITPVGTKAEVSRDPAHMTDSEYSKYRRQQKLKAR